MVLPQGPFVGVVPAMAADGLPACQSSLRSVSKHGQNKLRNRFPAPVENLQGPSRHRQTEQGEARAAGAGAWFEAKNRHGHPPTPSPLPSPWLGSVHDAASCFPCPSSRCWSYAGLSSLARCCHFPQTPQSCWRCATPAISCSIPSPQNSPDKSRGAG